MSFAKSQQEKVCSSQAETWPEKNILMKDFDWQVKFDIFIVSMATWTIECNFKISLLLSLSKICPLDFDWQVKFDIFVVSMATWTIECNFKISLLLSLSKIYPLDFPIDLHTAYYNYSLPFKTYLTKF